MFYLIAPLLWILLAGTVLLAWWRGGGAERVGATIMLIASIVVLVVHLILPAPFQALALLIDEAALAVGFLLVAMRYVSAWLGVAMILQAIQFSLHAYYLVGEKPHDYLYRMVNNLNTFAILLVIVVATLMTWRRRAASSAR